MKLKKHYYNEDGYIKLLSDIMKHGSEISDDRTGVGRRKLVNCTLTYDLRESMPVTTVRNAPPTIAIREFWAFLNGRPDIHNYLKEFGITIWEGNTTREFLDNRGLNYLPEGHGGKSYGFQYRNFNGEYDENFMPTGGIDQIKAAYDELKNNAFSSRIITSIWNPNQEKDMALPPCWWNHQFIVTIEDGVKVLNLNVTGRSCDVMYGTPYNIAQYAFYLAAMAKAQGMVAGELSANLVDAHIYGSISDLEKHDDDVNPASQMKYVMETIDREIYDDKVTLEITKDLSSFEDLLALTPDDFVLHGHRVNTAKYLNKRPRMAI
jgi:thymidylate synthase